MIIKYIKDLIEKRKQLKLKKEEERKLRELKEREEKIRLENENKLKFLNSLAEFKDVINNYPDIIRHIVPANCPEKIDNSIDFYDALLKLHLDHISTEVTQSNVLRILTIVNARLEVINKFGKSVADKIIKVGIFKGMTIEMFNTKRELWLAEGFPAELMTDQYLMYDGHNRKKIIFESPVLKIGWSDMKKLTFQDGKLISFEKYKNW